MDGDAKEVAKVDVWRGVLWVAAQVDTPKTHHYSYAIDFETIDYQSSLMHDFTWTLIITCVSLRLAFLRDFGMPACKMIIDTCRPFSLVSTSHVPRPTVKHYSTINMTS